jgi:hypothetical protein
VHACSRLCGSAYGCYSTTLLCIILLTHIHVLVPQVAVAERDTEIKALKSLREHSVAVQVEAMVSKRAMEEARYNGHVQLLELVTSTE